MIMYMCVFPSIGTAAPVQEFCILPHGNHGYILLAAHHCVSDGFPCSMLTICSGGHAMFLHSGRSTSPSSAGTTPCTIATYRFRTSRSRNCPDERNSTCEQASLQTTPSCSASGHRSAALAIASAAKLQSTVLQQQDMFNGNFSQSHKRLRRLCFRRLSATCKRPTLLYHTTPAANIPGVHHNPGGSNVLLGIMKR